MVALIIIVAIFVSSSSMYGMKAFWMSITTRAGLPLAAAARRPVGGQDGRHEDRDDQQVEQQRPSHVTSLASASAGARREPAAALLAQRRRHLRRVDWRYAPLARPVAPVRE